MSIKVKYRQLQHDGFHAAATVVSQAALVPPPASDTVKNRLFTLVQPILYKEREKGETSDLRGILIIILYFLCITYGVVKMRI